MKFNKKDLTFSKDEKTKLAGAQKQVRKGSNTMVRKSSAHKDKTKYDRTKGKKDLKHGIHEDQVLDNARLNDHQKSVLAILMGDNEGKTTVGDITSKVDQANKQNTTMAIQNLQKLGAVDIDQQQTLKVTDKGRQQMTDEKLADEGGTLTADGEKYKTMFSSQETDEQEPEMMGNAPVGGVPAPGMNEPMQDPSMMGMGAPQQPTSPFGESISLIRKIVEDIEYNRLLKKFRRV